MKTNSLFASILTTLAVALSGCTSLMAAELLKAVASADVVNGAVSAINILDVGAGYYTPPVIVLAGGNGTGATAIATVAKGSITGIKIVNPGSGYKFAPTVWILDGSVPPDTAKASVSVANGALNIATVIYSGSGYVTNPEVRVVGGGGSGGAVITVLDKGKISSVIVVSRGGKYSSAPTLIIDPPPNWVWTAPKINIIGIESIRLDGNPGNLCQIEWSRMLPPYDMWSTLTNVTVGPTGYSVVDFKADEKQRYFRCKFGPPEGFVRIEPGYFLMGQGYYDPPRNGENGPQFAAYISKGFWICDHEVTQREMLGYLNRDNSIDKGADLPVDNISWAEAFYYADRVTEVERRNGRLPLGYKYKLPTEAQWEYSCRAGTTGPYSGDPAKLVYPSLKIHKVRLTSPNPWGLYEMHGNVSEWCLDAYAGGNKYKPIGRDWVVDPVGDLPPVYVPTVSRVSRGGYSYTRLGAKEPGKIGLRLVIVEEW